MFRRRYSDRRVLGGLLKYSGQIVHWGIRILLVCLVLDLFYLSITWPDWRKIANGPIPKSSFISHYQDLRRQEKNLPRLRWHPIPIESVPKYVTRAIILAEDVRFYHHNGFDLLAFKEAMDHNINEGRMIFGGSTISQQTVKNLFLNPSRNLLRKWHELVLTWGMERHLKKRRIMEIYLNIAEFGEGVYGVEAAAHHYWGKSARHLNVRQALELAATLPSPNKHNPQSNTKQLQKRVERLRELIYRFPGEAEGVL